MADDDYRQALEKDSRDLLAAARERQLSATEFRDEEARGVVEALDRGRSVLLVGPDGAGKTAIVHEVARLLAARDPASGAVKGLRALTTVGMLAGTRYLGEWQSKATEVARSAMAQGAVLYFSDIWNLDSAGRSSSANMTLREALWPFLESGRLLLLGETSPEMLRRIERVPGFVQLFHRVNVAPLAEAQAEAVVQRAAERMGLPVDLASRRALLQLTARFLPSRPPPGAALRLLEQVRDYHEEKKRIGELEAISPAFVERVFSIYSGLPLFVISPNTTRPAHEIRAWFQERIVGQHEAIEAVVETIALYKAGLQDPTKPIGTFLFVGPTGVGKTELARALATYLFGSATRLLRFDLSEYKDFHAFELLVGNPREPDAPARLIDPVRVQPFQVVLLDELEKAHANIWDLLLPLLDEGHLTSSGGRRTDFRNTLVIATSNVGAQGAERSMGFGAESGTQARRDRTRQALEAAFRPEFLNRFQHVVVFHALDAEQVRTIARQELKGILQREGITRRNLVVEVDDSALDLAIRSGFDPRYGARALKRELQRHLVLPLAMTLMERDLAPGNLLKVGTRDGQIQVRVIDTAESREHRREQAPVAAPGGKKVTREDLARGIGAVRERVAELARTIDEPFLHHERGRLLQLRAEPDFWRDARAAARDLRDLDQLNLTLERVDRLRARAEGLQEALAGADTRTKLGYVSNDLARLEADLDVAARELLVFGRNGRWDALVEIRPIGATGRMARDLLVDTYTRWASAHRLQVEWLFEPRGEGESPRGGRANATDADEDPAMLAFKGRYPYGLLRGESGVHRVRRGDLHGAARVRVAPWTDADDPVRFGEHRALKEKGAYGGAIRSCLTCHGGLSLQNGRTLAENRELAQQVAPSWALAPAPQDDVVRRYDLEPLLIRDVLTDESSGKLDALAPEPFHALLVRRADALGPLPR